MRYSLLLLILALVLSYVVGTYFDPARPGALVPLGDPVKALNDWYQQDDELHKAVLAADRGEGLGLLTAWLNRADPLARQRAAGLLLASIARRDAQGRLREPLDIDDQEAYRYRARFRAFIDVGTGSPDRDQLLDNLIAYTAVAGTPHPNDTDLQVAALMLERLTRRLKDGEPDAMVADTVGCIHYVNGRYGEAQQLFDKSLVLIAKLPEAERQAMQPLTAARAQAAAVAKAGGTAPPLPLAWTLNGAAAPSASPGARTSAGTDVELP